MKQEDEENYSFTKQIRDAWKFYTLTARAPKYLWNEKENIRIQTLQEACEYFQGKMVKVKEITTYQVEDVDYE
jgi:hypothetical protein